MSEPSTWLNRTERGTVFGIRAAFFWATAAGRWPTRPIVSTIALWYRLFDRRAVATSRAWLTRVDGRPPSFWRIYRHLRMFAQVTLDRVFLLKGRTKGLRFTRTGHDLLVQQAATGKGALLIGAHLGSYEALRAGGDEDRIAINILGYFANAKMINALLEQLDPHKAAKVMHLGEDPVGVMAKVQERLEHGEFVAMMADRTGLNDRNVHAEFFGQPAAFSAGPFLLASILRCPVYLVFGLYSEPNRYDLHCERFADRIDLPRKDREAGLQKWTQLYAARIEHHARQAPLNWFNFFDFWAPPKGGEPKA